MNKLLNNPKQICVDNKTTESVQLFTIKSKFAVRTFTALHKLQVADDCDCGNVDPPPRHFVFLVDSSDSFNSGDSNSPGNSWFDTVKKFLVNFIKEANFGRGPVTISVYNFSGFPQASGRYKPGTRGLIDIANPSMGVHYRVEVENLYVSNLSPGKRADVINIIEKMEALDGNGLMWLALQDLTSDSFGKTSKKAFTKNGIHEDMESVLVVITDTEWDLKGLKDTKGALAKESVIIGDIRKSFSRVFAVAGTQQVPVPSYVKSPEFQLAQMVKREKDLSFFGPKTIQAQLEALKRRLFEIYKF